jgi:hypothetical protein
VNATVAVSVATDVLDDWATHAESVREMAEAQAKIHGARLIAGDPVLELHDGGALVRYRAVRA